MKRKLGYVYRICRRCGGEYNISRQEPGGKKYLCPACEGKRKAAYDGANITDGKGSTYHKYLSKV